MLFLKTRRLFMITLVALRSVAVAALLRRLNRRGHNNPHRDATLVGREIKGADPVLKPGSAPLSAKVPARTSCCSPRPSADHDADETSSREIDAPAGVAQRVKP